MIVPGYSVTATERVLPRMALDFTTAALDSRVTVTRALNTATRVNSSGYIETVNADLPRFDYDATTLVCKGLLIEETRANACPYSTLANGGNTPSGWTLVLGTSGVSSASTILGTASGAYTFTASSNRQIIAQGGLTAAANTTYTVSLYVESNPNSALASQMLSIVGNPAGSTFTAPAGTPAAGTRITATLVVGATAGTFDLRLGIGVTGNTTGTVRISCPQIEAGTFATSYIPTTTTSLTRNADVVSMTGTNFSDWYNATQGTFFAQYTAGLNGVFAFSAVNSTTPTTEAMYLRYNASQHQGVTVTGGVNVSAIFDVTGASAVNNVKTAFAYKANAYGIRSNGGASATAAANSASGALPSGINKLSIGSNQTGAAGFLNACIAKLSYYNISLLNAELSAVSK